MVPLSTAFPHHRHLRTGAGRHLRTACRRLSASRLRSWTLTAISPAGVAMRCRQFDCPLRTLTRLRTTPPPAGYHLPHAAFSLWTRHGELPHTRHTRGYSDLIGPYHIGALRNYSGCAIPIGYRTHWRALNATLPPHLQPACALPRRTTLHHHTAAVLAPIAADSYRRTSRYHRAPYPSTCLPAAAEQNSAWLRRLICCVAFHLSPSLTVNAARERSGFWTSARLRSLPYCARSLPTSPACRSSTLVFATTAVTAISPRSSYPVKTCHLAFINCCCYRWLDAYLQLQSTHVTQDLL